MIYLQSAPLYASSKRLRERFYHRSPNINAPVRAMEGTELSVVGPLAAYYINIICVLGPHKTENARTYQTLLDLF